MGKMRIEAITVREGEEFEMGDGDQMMMSELMETASANRGDALWGLVVMRAVKDEESESDEDPRDWINRYDGDRHD